MGALLGLTSLALFVPDLALCADEPGMIPSLTRAEEEEIRKTGILLTPTKNKIHPFLKSVGREVLGLSSPFVRNGGNAYKVKKLEEQAKSDNPNIKRNALRELMRYRYVYLWHEKTYKGEPLKDRLVRVRISYSIHDLTGAPEGASVLYQPRGVTVNGRKAYANGGLNPVTYVPNGFILFDSPVPTASCGIFLRWKHDMWSIRIRVCRRYKRPFDLKNDARWADLLAEAVKYGEAIDKMLGDPPSAPVTPSAESGLLNPDLRASLDPVVVRVPAGGDPVRAQLHALPSSRSADRTVTIAMGTLPPGTGIAVKQTEETLPVLPDLRSFPLLVSAEGSTQPGITKVPITVKQGARREDVQLWVLTYHEDPDPSSGGGAPPAAPPPVFADGGEPVSTGIAEAARHLARARDLGRTRDPRAALAYGEALELMPADAGVWAELGAFHIRRGQFAKGVVALEKAVKLDPNVYRYRSQLADALFYMGRRAEGMRQAQEALRIEQEGK